MWWAVGCGVRSIDIDLLEVSLNDGQRDLPFIPATGMFHLPVLAEVSVRFDNRQAPQPPNTLHCLAHVKTSLKANPAPAAQFQEHFLQRRNEHAHDVNAAMLQA